MRPVNICNVMPWEIFTDIGGDEMLMLPRHPGQKYFTAMILAEGEDKGATLQFSEKALVHTFGDDQERRENSARLAVEFMQEVVTKNNKLSTARDLKPGDRFYPTTQAAIWDTPFRVIEGVKHPRNSHEFIPCIQDNGNMVAWIHIEAKVKVIGRRNEK